MTWFITVLLMLATLAALLPVLLLLLAVIDHPRTEEGWRRELASTGGFEHRILSDAYCICHYKKGNKKDGTKKPSRRKMATGESLFASGSAPLDSSDSSLGECQPELCDDANHRPIFCGSSRHRCFESLQGSSRRGAPYKASTPPPQPADEQDQNRPADRPESTASEPLQAGSGGRAGSLSAEHDSPFWKKLVENGERLGV